jgi:cysteine desulfurase/selenocysteine lyase
MPPSSEPSLPKMYLAYAAVAPPAIAVRRAVAAALELVVRAGPAAFVAFSEQRERLRVAVGRLLGTSAENIAFVSGTTRGLFDLAFSIPWRPRDRVVLFAGEFPANVTPWQRAAALFDLDVRFVSLERAVEDVTPVLHELEQNLRGGARLVAVSAVQFQTGLRMPLQAISELCRRYGAELAVDAIQACGVVPIDVNALGIDYLVCGAHKWMMGIDGAGFLYARSEAAEALEPRTAGWLSHEDPLGFLLEGPGKLRYDRPIRRELQYLEGSSMSSAGLAALGAAVDTILEQGPSEIFARVSRYLDALEAGFLQRGLASLRAREPAQRSGILSIAPPPGLAAGEVARGLRQRGVTVSTPDGLLRFAPHYMNPEHEVVEVLAALDETLAALRG